MRLLVQQLSILHLLVVCSCTCLAVGVDDLVSTQNRSECELLLIEGTDDNSSAKDSEYRGQVLELAFVIENPEVADKLQNLEKQLQEAKTPHDENAQLSELIIAYDDLIYKINEQRKLALIKSDFEVSESCKDHVLALADAQIESRSFWINNTVSYWFLIESKYGTIDDRTMNAVQSLVRHHRRRIQDTKQFIDELKSKI